MQEFSWQKLRNAEQQAYAEQLREAFVLLCERTGYPAGLGECPEKHILEAALSIPHDTTALRDYCARVVEKVATMTLSTYALKTIAALIREGTFDAT